MSESISIVPKNPLRITLVSDAVVIGSGDNPYIGEYTVTPKIEAQILPTFGKTMQEDLKILEIPRHDVTNQYGTTVTIGGI